MVVKLSYHPDDIVSCIVDSILSSNLGLISDHFEVKWKHHGSFFFDLVIIFCCTLSFYSKLDILFWSQIWQRINITIQMKKDYDYGNQQWNHFKDVFAMHN